MNIYINVEISARELDSKLLLATLAAAKGHDIIVSEKEIIEKGLLRGWLPPGIFHTKSLTPSKNKIDIHQAILKTGSKITAIDEEANIDHVGYDNFLKQRYSQETINQSSAVFSWGEEDFESLKKNYLESSDKFYKTGSPRVDLWKPAFSEYWNDHKSIAERPFLLIASNMHVCANIQFSERIKMIRESGYFDRTPDLFKERFMLLSDDYLKAFIFIEAIKYLSKNNNGYDIVFRPHPSESVECWKILLEGISNLHVVREGAISSWIRKAFAVMHHGCTTAIETSVSQKPLITYAAIELKNHMYQNILANQLGHIVTSKEDLSKKINLLFEKINNKSEKTNNDQTLPSSILSKIYVDNNELAAEKMIKAWENISDEKFFKPINLTKLKLFSFKLRINRLMGDILKKIFKSKFKRLGTRTNNQKFPPLNIKDINENVKKFQKILNIKKKIECRLVSDRTIIIRSV